jgi:hypothetical protein
LSFKNEGIILERSGNNQRFEFSIIAPGGQDTEEVSELSKNIAGGIKTAANVISAMRGTSRRLEWKLEARADLPGVDLASSKKIQINKF